MAMRISFLAWAAAFLAVAAPAGAVGGGVADERAGRAVSLHEAIRIALESSPGYAVARASAEAAAAGRREAEAARWPRLVADAGWRRSDQQVLAFGDTLAAGEFTAADFALDNLNHPDAQSHVSAGLGVEWPLFTSGRIRSAIVAGRAGEEAARLGTNASAADLVLRVSEAYHGVTLARSAIEVARVALENARGHEAAAAARVEAGSALRSDFLRARVDRLARDSDLERARADLQIALERLRQALGLAPAEIVEPSEGLPDHRDTPEPLERYVLEGAAARPEVGQARRTAAAARAVVEAARSALGPQAVLSARYERNASGLESGEGSFLVGVGLRWSVFDRGHAGRIEAAGARAAAAEAEARATEDRMRLEVTQAWHDLQVADHALGTAREAAEAAAEARRIGAERYAAGLLPLTDLLDIETALLRARLAELSARYAATVGRVRLARASGLLEVPR
jgi:outer membrane protein TolC